MPKVSGLGQMAEILMVEDNPDDAELTVEALRQAKMRNNLSIVDDGVKALDFLWKRGAYQNAPKPDLILLDLNLPRKDGREVLAEIKQDPSLRRIPVVVLTTSQSDEDIIRAYDLHVNCYIHKPVDLNQFLKAVALLQDFWLTVVTLPGE